MKTVIHITTVHNAFDNRIFYKECIGLVNKGYKVTLIAPHHRKEVVEGVEIEPLKKTRNRFVRFFSNSWRVYSKVSRFAVVDIVHFHDPELILVGLLIKIRKCKNIIYDIHEDYVTAINQKKYIPPLLRNFTAALFCKFEEKVSTYFSIVLAEKYYSTRFPQGIQILNYPQKSLFKELAYMENDLTFPNLIYTGNVTEDRGAIVHANIVNYIKDANVTYVGYCNEAIAEKIATATGSSKRIKIIGVNTYIPFNIILDYYKREKWTAGLAIFPPTPHYFRKELTKLFEYMGAGIPVICSDFPAWKELIEKTGSGICVNPDSFREICDAINFLLDNPSEAHKMGEYGRKTILEKLNWENELDKLSALYERIIKD